MTKRTLTLSRSSASTISEGSCGPLEEPRSVPAELVNMLDAGRRQLHHVVAVGGDETFEPVTDAQNGRRVVGVVGFKDNGPDHVVEAGAKAARR